jgi:hypothetical protein
MTSESRFDEKRIQRYLIHVRTENEPQNIFRNIVFGFLDFKEPRKDRNIRQYSFYFESRESRDI